jgi:hypothetical protein
MSATTGRLTDPKVPQRKGFLMGSIAYRLRTRRVAGASTDAAIPWSIAVCIVAAAVGAPAAGLGTRSESAITPYGTER